MNRLERTACLLALWCLLEGVVSDRTRANGTGSTTRFGEIGDTVDSFKALGEEVELKTDRSDYHYQHRQMSKRQKSNSDPAISKKIHKLEALVSELREKVKFLMSLYENDIDKRLNNTEKKMKKEITNLQNSLKKCCANKTKSSNPKDHMLTITADDVINLYFDGTKIKTTHGKQWDVPDIIPLPKETKVIAVKATNLYADSGLIASTDDGTVRTNCSWKCTARKEKGWEQINFDDSDWPVATEHMSYVEKPVKGIIDDARWIWTEDIDYKTGHKTVYCRFTISSSKIHYKHDG